MAIIDKMAVDGWIYMSFTDKDRSMFLLIVRATISFKACNWLAMLIVVVAN